MCDIIGKRSYSAFSTTVLIEIVMLIFTEVPVDVRYSIPVFRTECYPPAHHVLSVMPYLSGNQPQSAQFANPLAKRPLSAEYGMASAV